MVGKRKVDTRLLSDCIWRFVPGIELHTFLNNNNYYFISNHIEAPEISVCFLTTQCLYLASCQSHPKQESCNCLCFYEIMLGHTRNLQQNRKPNWILVPLLTISKSKLKLAISEKGPVSQSLCVIWAFSVQDNQMFCASLCHQSLWHKSVLTLPVAVKLLN